MNKYINNDISAPRSFGKKVCQEVEIKKKRLCRYSAILAFGMATLLMAISACGEAIDVF